MIRFFHTADWHLGQTFHGYDRDSEHAAFLVWLLARLKERRPHALLIAGDLFDTVNPSAASQRRYYAFLAEAHKALPDLQVVLIAGNHDAAARLEAPAALFDAFNIRVVGTIPRRPDQAIDQDRILVPLRGDSGDVEAVALAVPFLRPADVPELPEANNPYLDGIRKLYHDLTRDAAKLRDDNHPGAALLALGHHHFAGGRETGDSERRIVIGNAEALRHDTFPPELAYVALGHLHLPQSLDEGRIRYCGSPLPLSFSELNYEHQILEVTVEQGRVGDVTPHLIPRAVSLIRVPERSSAPLPVILDTLAKLPAADSDPCLWPYVEVHVLDEGPDPTRRHRIESALENKAARLAGMRLDSVSRPGKSDGAANAPRDAAGLQALEPIALVSDHHRQRYGKELSPDVLACLQEVILAAKTADETATFPR